MNRLTIIESFVRNYVLHGVTDKKNIELVANLVLGKELKLLRSNVCPYCLKRFRRKHSLIIHLHQSDECRLNLEADVKYVLNTYIQLMNRVRVRKKGNGIRLEHDKVYLFRNIDEFREFVKNHPELLNNLNSKVIK